MYERHWQLNQRPFDDAASPQFFFAGPTHQAALLKLRYLIDQRKGIGIIVGEHGLGKTFLSQVLEQESHPEGVGPFVRLLVPQLSPNGMLSYIAARLGANVSDAMSDEHMLRLLEAELESCAQASQHPVIFFDDAHLLEMPHLNAIRLFLNLRESGQSDFTVILSGRSDLLGRLNRIAPLDQRIAVRTVLEPLRAGDIVPYIRHRFETAGGRGDIFADDVANTIFRLSQGVPRRINQICDLALLVGFADQLRALGPVEFEAAAEELVSVRAA